MNPSGESPWPWPESLDAIVAAPAHHVVLFENNHVRVLDARIAPGDTVPLHTHRWPSVLHILSSSDFVRRNVAGEVELDTRRAPATRAHIVWLPPLPPHTLENVGDVEIHVISVELKQAAG
jgi:hypothetical protein